MKKKTVHRRKTTADSVMKAICSKFNSTKKPHTSSSFSKSSKAKNSKRFNTKYPTRVRYIVK